MKAILEFDISPGENDEQYDFKLATHANQMHSALTDISNELRKYRKYIELEKYTSEKLFEELDENIGQLLRDGLSGLEDL